MEKKLLLLSHSVFLPETAEEKLPQTVEEAEDFGIGQPLLTIPLLLRMRKKKMEE